MGAAGPNPFIGPAGTAVFTGAPFAVNKSFGLNVFGDGTSLTILVGEVVVVDGRLGRDTESTVAYKRSLELSANPAERRYIEARISRPR